MMNRIVVKSGLLCLVLACVGCGESGPVMYPVSGTVKWNNAPLTDGSITFEPLDASLAPAGGKIINGSYSLRASAGKCRVRIFATRPGQRVNAQMGAAPAEQYIPDQYNSATTLDFDVSATAKNEKSFELVP